MIALWKMLEAWLESLVVGRRVSSLPTEYLGLPLGASFKDKFIWDSNIEKMECRLAG
jgi:hypothetical protein